MKSLIISLLHFRCRYDYIEFRDGGTQDSPVMNVGYNNNSRICGDQLPGSVLSTGNALYVRFFTDSSVTSVGFKAEYKIGEYIEYLFIKAHLHILHMNQHMHADSRTHTFLHCQENQITSIYIFLL